MSARAATYLDSNAGAPLRPEAVAALSAFFRVDSAVLANPSSIHSHGRRSKRLLAEAREKIALSLGEKTDPEQLIFTSSGTEANQLAIRSVLEPLLLKGMSLHWITTPVEHDSVLQMIPWLEARGGTHSFLPVDSTGSPIPGALKDLIRPETALISLLWVNNETGVVSDVPAFSEQTKSAGIKLHLDAAQAWGKIPMDLESLGAQIVSFSGHKIGALAGIGGLWAARGTRIEPQLLGKQEKGRRGGTENLLGIVSMGAAATALNPKVWAERVAPLRDRLQSVICSRIPGTMVNGMGAERVANTLNLSFSGVEGDGLIMALDLAGFSVSAGSACSSGAIEPSHVLRALGRTREEAMASIRVSLTDAISWETLEHFTGVLEETVARIRRSRMNAASPAQAVL